MQELWLIKLELNVINSFNYDEELAVASLVKKLCDFKQSYTQYGGVRPFGTAMLIAGIDASGPHLQTIPLEQ